MEDPVAAIREAAAALFADKGYDGTSLQDVAGTVGITKAGLYHYFPTKQALYQSIVLATLQDLRREVETAVAAADTAEARLLGFMAAHARFFQQNRDRYRASFFGRTEGDPDRFSPDELSARKAYVRCLETVLTDGVADGSLAVADVPTFARGILGMLNWMARWYSEDGPLSAVEIAESYGRTLVAGLAAKP